MNRTKFAVGGTRNTAFWATIRGASLALSAFSLSLLLARQLDVREFNTWVLIFGVVSWFPFVEAGLSSAVIRISAQFPLESRERRSVALTGATLLIGPVLFLCLVLVVVSYNAETLFPKVGAADGLPLSLTIIGLASASSVIVLPFAAFLLSVDRMKFLALNSLGFKSAQLVGSLATAAVFQTLLPTAIVWALIELAHNANLVRQCRGLGGIRPDRSEIRSQLVSHVRGYIVWACSGLFVSRLDVVVVGRVDPTRLGVYGLGLAVATLLPGFHSAMVVTVVPTISRIVAEGRDPVPWVYTFSRKVNILLAGATVLGVFFSNILSTWLVAAEIRSSFVRLTAVLLVANWLRLSCAIYASTLIALGKHTMIRLSPLTEAFTNFSLSVLLGWRYGAYGVAFGTLAGSAVSVLLHLLYNMRRFPIPGLSGQKVFRTCVSPSVGIVGCGLLVYVLLIL